MPSTSPTTSVRVLHGNPGDADVAALVAALCAVAAARTGQDDGPGRDARARPTPPRSGFRPPAAWGAGAQPW